MSDTTFIQNGLRIQELPAYQTDIPYIQSILITLHNAENSLIAFPNLNKEVPITVVDKRLFR